MFYTPEEMGIFPEKVNEIVEQLWKEEQVRNCPDCAVKPNTQHKFGCDVAQCKVCGLQAIGCDCEYAEPDMWTGIWPGIKECYEQKLICFDSITNHWRFDLNTLAVNNTINAAN